jgi:hypothetical protein
MLNFCTLFNVNYLAKGLALHSSLLKKCPAFHLYIFAFDDTTHQILTEKRLANTTIIALAEFETTELLAVKKDRSVAEYCWTCTPFTIKYCIHNFKLDHCTYIDADTYFYNDPTVLIDEMGDKSVLITPHNYNSQYDQSAVSGIYCVQFTTFKNTTDGVTVLNWWAQACLKWCYNRYEDGKMGDQKYLDSWPYMFNGIYICRDVTAGLAPWNALNYTYNDNPTQITVDGQPLLFYHFHDLKYLSNNTWYLGGYEIPLYVVDNIYKPYIKTLLAINDVVKSKRPGVDSLYTTDFKNQGAFNSKYKMGIYVLDLKRSFKQFITNVLFINRKKHYKNNYLQIN